MRSIVTDAWSVCLSVDRSFCHSLEPCKMAELIEMPFGVWTRVGRPGNHALDGDPDPPCEQAILRGITLSARQMAG